MSRNLSLYKGSMEFSKGSNTCAVYICNGAFVVFYEVCVHVGNSYTVYRVTVVQSALVKAEIHIYPSYTSICLSGSVESSNFFHPVQYRQV